MRIVIPALAALLLATASAAAAEVEGKIKSLDAEKLTITLDNGQTYKLPAEVDMSAIKAGTEIVIAVEEVNGAKQITDMAIME